jgi:hypothetical protein
MRQEAAAPGALVPPEPLLLAAICQARKADADIPLS